MKLEDRYWFTKDGRYYKIADLSRTHIKRLIMSLKRKREALRHELNQLPEHASELERELLLTKYAEANMMVVAFTREVGRRTGRPHYLEPMKAFREARSYETSSPVPG